mgnify:CR=1 FL=1
MLVERSIVEKYLRRNFDKLIMSNCKPIELIKYVEKKYNMSGEVFSDYYSGRISLDHATEFELYIMVDSIQVYTLSKDKLPGWFTERELTNFSVTKFSKEEGIEFPITFNVIQITDDQWIGKIDARTINELRKKSLINYNTETQRTMQKVIRHGNESYTIMVNKKAVNDIKSDFEDESFISNTITLNISPDDEKADFYYKDHELVVNDITAFDITDGYHRYLAIAQEVLENPNFNYPMEVRITNFDVSKAQRFIFQEDQKTKMKKTDSNSYNNYTPSNTVVTRLNSDISSNIKGMISRNEGLINYGMLADAIHSVYFSGYIKKNEERIKTIKVSKELIDDFNLLTETDLSFLERKYSNADIYIIIALFGYYSDKDKSDMVDTIKYVIDHVEDFSKTLFYGKLTARVQKMIINKGMERS